MPIWIHTRNAHRMVRHHHRHVHKKTEKKMIYEICETKSFFFLLLQHGAQAWQ